MINIIITIIIIIIIIIPHNIQLFISTTLSTEHVPLLTELLVI